MKLNHLRCPAAKRRSLTRRPSSVADVSAGSNKGQHLSLYVNIKHCRYMMIYGCMGSPAAWSSCLWIWEVWGICSFNTWYTWIYMNIMIHQQVATHFSPREPVRRWHEFRITGHSNCNPRMTIPGPSSSHLWLEARPFAAFKFQRVPSFQSLCSLSCTFV